MKKILSYIVLALSLVTLVACGKSEAAKLTRTSSQQSQSQGKVTLIDRKSTRLNSSHITRSRMPSSA